MSAAQHTPGPWKVGYRALDIMAPNPKGGEAKIFDVRGWGFLTGKGHGALGLSEEDAEAVQQANAQLAAAAPDMLKMLKFFVAVRDWNHDEAESARREYDSVAGDAAALIAKAEGQS